MVDILLTARAGERRQLHVQGSEVVTDMASTNQGLHPLLQNGVLCGNAYRAPARVAVMTVAGRDAKLFIVGQSGVERLVLPILVMIAAQRKEHALADRHGIRPESQGLGDVGAGANSARDD